MLSRIQTDSLQDAAVATAKMADAAATAAKLAAGVARANFGAGAVLQVVQGTYATYASTSGSTYLDTGLTATITPTKATSKILVIVSQSVETYASNSTHMGLKIQRNGTDVLTNSRAWGDGTNAANDLCGTASMTLLDSPASVSALTYKTQYAAANNVGGSYGNYVGVQTSGNTSVITLLEIAA